MLLVIIHVELQETRTRNGAGQWMDQLGTAGFVPIR